MNSKKVAIAAGSSIAGALSLMIAAYFMLNNNQGDVYGSSSPNPCDDFYQYACGKWITDNPLSNGIDSITTVSQAQRKIDEYIWKLLTDDSYSSNDLRLQAASKVYKSCTNFRNSDSFISACRQWIYMYFGQWGLMPSTQQIDGAPNIENMDLTDFCLPAIMQFGYSLLFSIDIDPRARSIICKRSKENFYRMANLLRIPTFHNNAIDTAFQMMKDLCKVNDPKSPQSPKLKRNITLQELSLICPEIRWSDLFAKVFKEAEYEDYEGLPITIEGEEQLKQRCKQHASALQTDRKTFQTMMIINFVSELLKYTLLPSTKKTTDPSTSLFDDECIRQVKEAFAYTIERYYLPSHVNETHKKKVTTIFDEVKRTVLKSIPEYIWLTRSEKEFVSKKIEKMKIHALYTNLSDLEKKENNSAIYRHNYYVNAIIMGRARNMDKFKSHLSPSDVSLSPSPVFNVDIFYQTSKNRVNVNAGLIQPPFYIDGDDMLSNYGRIGLLIGHEIFHSIDTIGTRWGENGNLQKSKFSRTLSIKVYNKSKCFQEQYGKDETIKHKIASHKFVDEIIADNGAIHVLFKGFKQLIRKLAGHVSQDPDTTQRRYQSFFHGFAEVLCGEYSGKALERYIKDTYHVLNKYRVNFALSNSKEFSLAYHCRPGSPMNPLNKCRVY
ncbi:Neprilysin-2 [Schistosoma japonicum]|nr:Neprilysin-2 [Schistosoma japonicum]